MQSGKTRVRVVIVEDHPLFREGLRSALESAGDLHVTGEARTLSELSGAVAAGRPQVVVMDVTLPDGSGIEATRLLGEQHPELRVRVLTMADDDATLLAALRAGARGYLVKGAGREEVLHAVRTVAAGGAGLGAAGGGGLRGRRGAGPGGGPAVTPGPRHRRAGGGPADRRAPRMSWPCHETATGPRPRNPGGARCVSDDASAGA